MIGIYKITSPSGRIYIGQSWDIDQRFDYYKRPRCKKQRKLYNSLRKYSSESHIFEIIHELPIDSTQFTIDQYEALYIDLYRSCRVGMLNIRDGGRGGKHSKETKAKMSESRKRYYLEGNGGETLQNFIEYSKQPHIRKIVGEKVKEYWKENEHPRRFKVYQYNLDKSLKKEWQGVNLAAKSLGIQRANISKAIKSGKIYKGFIWSKI